MDAAIAAGVAFGRDGVVTPNAAHAGRMNIIPAHRIEMMWAEPILESVIVEAAQA